MRVDPRADRRAALREADKPFQRTPDALTGVIDLRTPSVEFLTKRHRHRVHQVCTARLYHITHVVGLFLEHARQVFERRQEL